MQTILAIFKDSRDAGSWSAYLDGIAALWTISAADDPDRSLSELQRRGIDPAVVIVSSRLYPAEDPDLVGRVRNYFPAAEPLLLSFADDPAPPLSRLAADSIRHLSIDGGDADADGKGYFDRVMATMLDGRPVSVSDRLSGRHEVMSFQVLSSTEKEGLLRQLGDALHGEGELFEMLRQRAALLADELIENALYGAPQAAQGVKLFSKGEPRETLPGERLTFSFAFDGETLAMEMSDNWGTLDPDLVVEYLARNQEQAGCEDLGGRGLFLIWRFFDHFQVTVYPGVRTVVGGDLSLSTSLDLEAPRGFHVTEHKKGETACHSL
ncbi:hypothetical protein [Geomonas sp. Red276]